MQHCVVCLLDCVIFPESRAWSSGLCQRASWMPVKKVVPSKTVTDITSSAPRSETHISWKYQCLFGTPFRHILALYFPMEGR
ncbi:hypothetical protein O181_005542 [Austropuccinia psidii MF-1]|uniref:Uncharacterized protein n=1 Tax=Austropuccinia psidii MF-1 TaxID=1389203 RepID=A0A9Q3BIY6_9BASI|nr:hypothetical protein [Austropuccinia psidii MF-1]